MAPKKPPQKNQKFRQANNRMQAQVRLALQPTTAERIDTMKSLLVGANSHLREVFQVVPANETIEVNVIEHTLKDQVRLFPREMRNQIAVLPCFSILDFEYAVVNCVVDKIKKEPFYRSWIPNSDELMGDSQINAIQDSKEREEAHRAKAEEIAERNRREQAIMEEANTILSTYYDKSNLIQDFLKTSAELPQCLTVNRKSQKAFNSYEQWVFPIRYSQTDYGAEHFTAVIVQKRGDTVHIQYYDSFARDLDDDFKTALIAFFQSKLNLQNVEYTHNQETHQFDGINCGIFAILASLDKLGDYYGQSLGCLARFKNKLTDARNILNRILYKDQKIKTCPTYGKNKEIIVLEDPKEDIPHFAGHSMFFDPLALFSSLISWFKSFFTDATDIESKNESKSNNKPDNSLKIATPLLLPAFMFSSSHKPTEANNAKPSKTKQKKSA